MPTLSGGHGPTWTERTRRRKDGQPYKRNVWHCTLMQTYSDAAWFWWQESEAFSSGYATEAADFRRDNPHPLLKDFMVRLSRDWRDQQQEVA